MPATIIDGKAIAANVRSELKEQVDRLREKHGRVPGLAAIIVGSRKDSETYVRLKHQAAAGCGFKSFNVVLPEAVTQEELEAEIRKLNADAECHGIIVQLPLPDHIDESRALDCIAAEKDADALLPINVGLLHSKGREPLFLPCTPAGVIELLVASGVTIRGKSAVVLGRSNIVGAPVAALLMKHNATVTVVHSATPREVLVSAVQSADIVIAAMGQPGFVQGEWIKNGAAVIDVGTTPVDDPSKKSGYRLAGDVCFEAAAERAQLISPVPGGVGPMTIAMLLKNTLQGFRKTVGDL